MVDSGIPTELVKKQISVLLDADLLAELDRLSISQKRSRSNLIEWTLSRALELGKAVSG